MKKDRKRFFPVEQVDEIFKELKKMHGDNADPDMHCQICGDTQPRHGFYPMYGAAIGFGIRRTSGMWCNRCRLSDEDYERMFGEKKEVFDEEDKK